MEELDQAMTQWKKSVKRDYEKSEDELWNLPEKTERVIEFENLKKNEAKQRVRESEEWPEIKWYYDRYHEVIQHNISFHAHRMRMGLEPIGKVQYVGNMFVQPIHDSVPVEERWEKGPDGISHKPSCEYRMSGYNKLKECHCGKRRERRISGGTIILKGD